MSTPACFFMAAMRTNVSQVLHAISFECYNILWMGGLLLYGMDQCIHVYNTFYGSRIQIKCALYKTENVNRMGNFQTDLNWYVYRRAQSTDEWIKKPLHHWGDIQLDEALARFKHEVYTFVLEKHMSYEDTKTIYLYQGSERIAKAFLNKETKQLEIRSSSIREWLTCTENVSQKRMPPYKDSFFKLYLDKHTWIDPQTVAFASKE